MRGKLYLNVTIPAFLTPKKTLELRVKLMKVIWIVTSKALQEPESEGSHISDMSEIR